MNTKDFGYNSNKNCGELPLHCELFLCRIFFNLPWNSEEICHLFISAVTLLASKRVTATNVEKLAIKRILIAVCQKSVSHHFNPLLNYNSKGHRISNHLITIIVNGGVFFTGVMHSYIRNVRFAAKCCYCLLCYKRQSFGRSSILLLVF